MSLVFIASNYETFTPTQSGALATIMHECCRAAQQRGVEPWVIARRAEAAPFDWTNKTLLDAPRVASSGAGWWLARAERKLLGWSHPGQRAYAHAMVRAVSEHNLQSFPLVVLNNMETAILLKQKFPRARVFHWFQNQLEAKRRVRRALPKVLSGAWGVSDFTARWVQEYYGFASSQMATVYNATDANHFVPLAEYEDKSKVVINFVGRTGREKAPDLLLRAALLLTEATTNFQIQIVGSNHWDHFEMDDYQRELSNMAKQLEAKGIKVLSTGHVARADLPQALRRADINVVPSRWDEPFGMVTLEAMSCGLATVASRTGGTPEVCGDAALLFERDNVEQLASHLKTLVEQPALRREYSARGRERALLFAWQRTWETIWKEINGKE
jgi:glycosyltransferase involved in cell wall biosynthesis